MAGTTQRPVSTMNSRADLALLAVRRPTGETPSNFLNRTWLCAYAESICEVKPASGIAQAGSEQKHPFSPREPVVDGRSKPHDERAMLPDLPADRTRFSHSLEKFLEFSPLLPSTPVALLNRAADQHRPFSMGRLSGGTPNEWRPKKRTSNSARCIAVKKPCSKTAGCPDFRPAVIIRTGESICQPACGKEYFVTC